MIKTRTRVLSLVAAIMLLVSCFTAFVLPAVAEENVPRDPSETLDILFIGNSFTNTNSMAPNIFKPICEAAGYTVNVDTVLKGGWFLYKFASEADEYGAKVQEKLTKNSYDIVILQEQSGCPIANPALFYYGARQLAEMVKENGAELWYYQTWGYKAGYSKLPTHGGTTEAMEMKLRAAYTAIAEETGGKVAHAGLAMLDVHQNYGSAINLYKSDLYHPSIYGSTLAAYTLFAEIFNYDVRTVNYNGAVEAANATILKEAAYNATFGDNSVPEEHRVVSEGVTLGQNGNSSDIDPLKTVQPTAWPTADLISVLVDPTKEAVNGWQAPLKGDKTQIFSGIRGDNDKIASSEYSYTQLTDAQKKDIADIGNGVSVIGIEYMDKSKEGSKTGVANLVNGHWGSSMMTGMVFSEKRYDINGIESEDGEFAGLLTLNFGDIHTFDTIGYMSGNMEGFPQVQKVYVSDDGVNWTIVESACYDAVKLAGMGGSLSQYTASKLADPWNQNTPKVQVLFSMNGASGKYIRIGVIAGLASSGSSLTVDLSGVQAVNTRELLVFGKKGRTSDINPSNTVELSEWPTSEMISILMDSNREAENGWKPVIDDEKTVFSGIRGDKDQIASSEYSYTQLTEEQKADIADIGYGVSVIGVEKMDESKDGTDTAIQNLVNGHWGANKMLGNMIFGEKRYDVGGNVAEDGEFSGLITLNFGDIYTFDAIGYMSGSMTGFPQIQKVFVSDDGVNWSFVESASYDTVKMNAFGGKLTGVDSYKCPDLWLQKSSTKQVLFAMSGVSGEVSGKYIRIGIIAGLTSKESTIPTIDINAVQSINTREIVVFGKEGRTIEPDNHRWHTEYTVDVEPGCTTEGSKSIHCLHCELTKDETVIPATGHTKGVADGKVACSVCGEGALTLTMDNAVQLLRYIDGHKDTGLTVLQADINGDGKVRIFDAIRFLQLLNET